MQTRPQNSFDKTAAARVLIGTAVVAAAVTIPDISVGAMDSPYLRLDMRERTALLNEQIWSPSAGATAPLYAASNAAEQIAPTSLTLANGPRFAGVDEVMPLGFLEAGSERFDLAFAGVAMPTPAALTIPGAASATASGGSPRPSRADITAMVPARRARLIDVPQIANMRGLSGRTVQGAAPGRAANARSDTNLEAGTAITPSAAAANASLAAAFAGPMDVSNGMRGALPVPPATNPTADQTARAVPRVAPGSDLSSNIAAQSELVTKTHLDARVNGVMTGRVDFQQLNGTIAVRLGSIVDILRDRYSASELDSIAGASGLSAFLTLAELQAAGVPISYDPVYDELEFGIDYNDAPQAAKVQVEQIGVPSVGAERVMMDQIPR